MKNKDNLANNSVGFLAGAQRIFDGFQLAGNNLKRFISENRDNIELRVNNFPASQADRVKTLVLDGVGKGWYINEVLIFSYLNEPDESVYDLDAFLENQIVNEWGKFWFLIVRLYPERASLLIESKKAFEVQCYAAAIHLYFSQADGVFNDKFGKNKSAKGKKYDLFANGGEIAENNFGMYLCGLISSDSLGELLKRDGNLCLFRRIYNEAYKAGFSKTGTALTQNTIEIIDEDSLVIPNRHGVFHGIHKNYGTRRNALKCFSLLLFVIFAIHGDDAYVEFNQN